MPNNMNIDSERSALSADSERRVDYAMGMISSFASEWALVGGRFDRGNMLEQAENTKARIRRILEDDERRFVSAGITLASASAQPVTRLDVVSLIHSQMHRVYASTIDREDVDTKHMTEIEDAIMGIYHGRYIAGYDLRKSEESAPLPAPGEAGELAKLRAGQLKEPENGDGWRVEWWNENMRLMLPDSRALSRVQAYQNGATVMTFKDRDALPHSMGKGK